MLQRNPNVKRLLEQDDTSAIVLKTILDEAFGEDWYDWDPVTIYLELRSVFYCEASTECIDRINAIQTIMLSGVYFESLDTFMAITNTLSDGVPSFTVFDPATGPEIAWGITEVSLMRDLIPYGPSVKLYIKKTMQHEGVTAYPAAVNKALGIKDDETIVDDLEGLEVTANSKAIDEFMNLQLKKVIADFDLLGIMNQWEQLLVKQEMMNG